MADYWEIVPSIEKKHIVQKIGYFLGKWKENLKTEKAKQTDLNIL